MATRKWIVTCAIYCISAAAAGAGVDGITLSHYEPLERVSVHKDGADFSKNLRENGPVNLRFDALGRSFDLQLQPNAGLLAAMSRGQLIGDIVPYRGDIAGVPGSWVRIVITNGLPAGLVWDGESLYAIEAPGDSIVATTSPIVYRLKDAIIAPGALSCAGGVSMLDGASVYKTMVSNLSTAMAQGPGAVSEIDIGAVGDFEFTNAHGSNAEAAIITRLNNVDGIFSQQLGVQINVPVVDTFTDINDPFTDTTDSSLLLNELGTYRQGTPSQSSQGLTHLYTGRDLDGSTVGIAFTGALCSTFFGAGLSEGNGSATFDSLVAAHEIGHNFGAPHDSVPGVCESTPPDFIMSTTLNGSDQFSACSITEMQDDIAAASCITPLPSWDISVAFNDPPPTILLSNAATITFDVVNNGTQPAQNVVTDIALPNNVAFIAASSSVGSCTNGAGTVSCQLGDIAGSSAATVTVSADTIAAGVGDFDASVTADVDDNPGNNQVSARLTVDPAVNLVVNAPGTAQVIVDQNTTVSAVLENESTLDATSVTLSISLDTGLRANTAVWTIGTCTMTAQQVDCQATQFDNQSSSTVTIGVTGVTTGTKNYTVTLASAETDADPADNSVGGTVSVNSASGGNDDSGGGGLGLILLALLGGVALWRSRRSVLLT